MKIPRPRLLLIVDHAVIGHDSISMDHQMVAVAASLEGGARYLLARHLHGTPHEQVLFVRALKQLTERYGAYLMVRDRVDIALALDVAGVHLPESGMPTGMARHLLGPNRCVGRSCHDAEGIQRAFEQGADYVTLSPVFVTQSHPDAPPLGLERFRELCRNAAGPVLGLGGVTIENVDAVLAAGASGVALIRGILTARDPCAETARFLQFPFLQFPFLQFPKLSKPE